jgi:hypothetical protein
VYRLRPAVFGLRRALQVLRQHSGEIAPRIVMTVTAWVDDPDTGTREVLDHLAARPLS